MGAGPDSEVERLLGEVRAGGRLHGLGSATVAGRVGVHQSTVNAWLVGAKLPDVRHLLCWAAVVGLRVAIEDSSAVDTAEAGTCAGPVYVADEVARLMGTLRAVRLGCGRTQGSVASGLGVSEAQVSRWERGGRLPRLVMLLGWSGELGCTVRTRAGGWAVEPEVPRARFGTGPRPGSTAARRARAGIESWSG